MPVRALRLLGELVLGELHEAEVRILLMPVRALRPQASEPLGEQGNPVRILLMPVRALRHYQEHSS